jgi:hypothetical protein
MIARSFCLDLYGGEFRSFGIILLFGRDLLPFIGPLPVQGEDVLNATLPDIDTEDSLPDFRLHSLMGSTRHIFREQTWNRGPIEDYLVENCPIELQHSSPNTAAPAL